MIKHATRKLALALTLVVLKVPVGRAFAQLTTPATTGMCSRCAGLAQGHTLLLADGCMFLAQG